MNTGIIPLHGEKVEITETAQFYVDDLCRLGWDHRRPGRKTPARLEKGGGITGSSYKAAGSRREKKPWCSKANWKGS